MKRTDILVMCVANSARSQMAEAIARHLAPDGVQIYSAGSEPSQVNPFAVKALAEIDLSTRGHTSKGLDAIPIETIRWVITLCAEEVCPTFHGDVERLHWPHPDPAGAGDDPASILASFREVRDDINVKIEHFFESIN